MFFDDLSFDDNTELFMGKIININEDGYIYANMFKDEYKPYKDYKVYRINPKNEEESLKLKIMEEQFIVTDLGLYLDLHQNDQDVYEYFKKHNQMLNYYIDEYENKYGSICLNSNFEKYNWTNSPWPWEVNE